MIGQELQLGKRRSARRENACPKLSRRLTSSQGRAGDDPRGSSHSWENSRYNVTHSKRVCKRDPERQVGLFTAVANESNS